MASNHHWSQTGVFDTTTGTSAQQLPRAYPFAGHGGRTLPEIAFEVAVRTGIAPEEITPEVIADKAPDLVPEAIAALERLVPVEAEVPPPPKIPKGRTKKES